MEFFGLKFDSVAMNASGPKCTEFEELRDLALSDSSAIVTKSVTMEPREGNEKPSYEVEKYVSIQSMGLPNPGIYEMGRIVSKLREITKKPIITSVAGFSPKEYAFMSEHLGENGADMIEVNLSCPNVVGKPQPAYNAVQSREILEAVKDSVKLPISVKLPCYPDSVIQKRIADVLLDLKIDSITAINSIGNSILLKDKKPVIKPIWGGLCGSYIKPVALGTVHRFYKLFEGKIKIIGVGGIKNKDDIEDFLTVGADLVQIGTAYEQEGPSIFTRLI